MLSSHGGFLTIAMYHHREKNIKIAHYDETEERDHDSQIVRAIELGWAQLHTGRDLCKIVQVSYFVHCTFLLLYITLICI